MDFSERPAIAARARAEEPVEFAGPSGRLCGIFTPTAPDVSADSRCVIFPARPRFAFRRMPVLASRILAASGLAAMRFDLGGSGESDGPSEVDSRHNPHGADMSAAIEFLRGSRAFERFLVIGYCLDALCAIEAAITCANAIDGLVCIAPPATAEPIQASPMERLTRSAHSPVSLIARLKNPATMLRSGGKMIAALGAARSDPRVLPVFEQGVRALANAHARVLFLYGEDDVLRREFAVAERKLFPTLPEHACARLEVEIWPGNVHTVEMELAIFERAINWVYEFGPRIES